MFELFNWFGSILGYLLWFLYSIVRNYGVSILLFTIINIAAIYGGIVKRLWRICVLIIIDL